MPLDPSSVLLTNRVAVVTGAAVGIGRATAIALARFGCDLAICDRDEARLDETAAAVTGLGRAAVTGYLDVRERAPVEAFLANAATRFGRVDVLVNNAGGGFEARFLDVAERGEEALVRENFASVTHLVRGVVPLIPERGGSIVTMTSIEAHRAAPGYALYAAMKAALVSLTKTLAVELGPRRIRVNCVAPDVIPTPGIGFDVPIKTPLVRQGDVDDVAAAVVFLANDSLSGFVTGTTIHVDGGNLAAGGWHRQADGSYAT